MVLIGINTDEDEEDYRKKLVEFGVTWTNAWKGMEICSKFGVNSFPTIVVLDEAGRVQELDVRGEGMAVAVQRVLDGLKQRKVSGTR